MLKQFKLQNFSKLFSFSSFFFKMNHPKTVTFSFTPNTPRNVASIRLQRTLRHLIPLETFNNNQHSSAFHSSSSTNSSWRNSFSTSTFYNNNQNQILQTKTTTFMMKPLLIIVKKV